MSEFSDHFSRVSSQYASFRPTYPAELIRFVVEAAPTRSLAWDCATGTGQVAVALAEYVDRVVATDASAEQIRHAAAHPRVTYVAARAESCPLESGTVDLVTVGQALHWFNRDAFYREVQRVLRPDGVVAVWTYERLRMDEPELVAATNAFHDDVVGADWPPERALVGAGYLGLDFPFDELPVPAFEMRASMTRDALAGYLRTWSASQRYRARTGEDPVLLWEAAVAPHWPDAQVAHEVAWPMTVRVGRRRPPG